MSNFEFVIPVSKKDLLKKTNVNDYAVEEILPARRLPFHLKNTENDFKTNKHQIILTHFDTFYSIIEHFKVADADVPTGGWKLILKTMTSLATELLDLLEREQIEAEERSKHLNMVKMSCYILSLFIDKFESEAQVAIARNNASKSAKKKAPTKSSIPLVDVWDSERELGVKAILQLVQMKVERLYEPPILEEELITLVTGVCYRILETSHQAKSKSTRDSIFHVLGIMVKRHGHSFGCVVKLLQLMQQNEQLIAPLAQGVLVFCNNYGMKTIVGEMMREIGRIDAKELSRDSTCTKCFSTFLFELSRSVPAAVLPSISEVIHLLDEESYTMRNSILGMFGELILKLMVNSTLDDALKESRDHFLAHLLEHIHDVNAFVRSKVLQIWQLLIEEERLDLVSHFSKLMPLVNGRIQDKSSNVRKNAVQVLIRITRSNDATLKMSAEGLQTNLSKELDKLRQLELEKQKKLENDHGPDAAEREDSDEDEDPEKMDVSENETVTESGTSDTDYERLKTLVEYLKSSIMFIMETRKSISLIAMRLGSKVASDVTEAIEFLVTGYKAGLDECRVGVRSMLPLIFSKDKDVRDAVVEAYKDIYLCRNSEQKGSAAMVSSLIELAISAKTLGDKEALRELVQKFVKSNLLNDEVSKILLQKFTYRTQGATSEESKASLMIIGFIASEQVGLLEANMEVLIREGLEKQEDYVVVMETCLVLMSLVRQKKSADDIPHVLPENHKIFEVLIEIITTGILKVERPNFVPMVERAIAAVYKLAERPDAICTKIIIKQIEIMNDCTDGDCTLTEETEDNTPPVDFIDDVLGINEREASQKRHEAILCPSETLTRFLATCGHVAVQQLIHLDVNVFAEMKRQQRKQENQHKRDVRRKSHASVQSASAAGSARSKKDERTIEDDLGLVGNVAEDVEAEYVRKIIEHEVVTGGKNLLSLLEPIIVTICSNQVKFSDPSLSAVSALALAKFMCVSSECCEKHLRLLFTILEKSNHAIVRSNIIISLGDLASRFPNQLEPWTANIYNRLRDSSMDVRLNTLQILTQLILNDMIKVKGQISEIALCILDDDQSISYTAKMFFQEFARKANAIYNILPDIVSRLSDPDASVTEDQFQPIMKFLVSFIEKEKQSESLCEKLCHRMRATVQERQWRDLAYCISLLPSNERSIKKLQENFACFADKLQDQYVLDCILTAISNAKKFAKPDAKTVIEEFHVRVVSHNQKKGNYNNPEVGKGDDDLVRSFLNTSVKKAKAQTTSRKSRVVRKVVKSLQFDDDEGDDDDNVRNKTISKNTRGETLPRAKPRTYTEFNSSDDDLEFD